MPRFRNLLKSNREKNASHSLVVTNPKLFRQTWRSVQVNASRLKRITLVFSLCLSIVAIWFVLNSPTHAANPATGSISPTGANVVWQGPVSGGAGANEDTCVEGANCDTFKLTLTGT